jgi:hypothetical protein
MGAARGTNDNQDGRIAEMHPGCKAMLTLGLIMLGLLTVVAIAGFVALCDRV